LITQCAFAQTLAPQFTFSGFVLNVVWTWILLLVFTLVNQSYGIGPQEDAINKPWRPIPSKRISVETTKLLGQLIIPVSIAFSMATGGLGACLSIIAVNFYNHEGGGHAHWLSKNGCCALYYSAYEWGATLVASELSFIRNSILET
jgi:4-hydroxybenzoate polyprenyltransferase